MYRRHYKTVQRNPKSNNKQKACWNIIKANRPLIPPLTRLINECIEKSTFPECLKIAKVIPVVKKSGLSDLSHLRPIFYFQSYPKYWKRC
nr:unnamed protein product [Callosobruchus analis]